MECEVKQFCKNRGANCWICRAEDPKLSELFYRANSDKGAPKYHPLVEKEKLEAKKQRKIEKTKKTAERRKNTPTVQAVAEMIEKRAKKMADKVASDKAKKDFMSNTVNSGRVDRDVDHFLLGGKIRLDSKYQSKLINHQVKLDELDEARNKAMKFKTDLSGLILWNKDGRSVVVFDYKDWLDWESQKGTEVIESNDN